MAQSCQNSNGKQRNLICMRIMYILSNQQNQIRAFAPSGVHSLVIIKKIRISLVTSSIFHSTLFNKASTSEELDSRICSSKVNPQITNCSNVCLSPNCPESFFFINTSHPMPALLLIIANSKQIHSNLQHSTTRGEKKHQQRANRELIAAKNQLQEQDEQDEHL